MKFVFLGHSFLVLLRPAHKSFDRSIPESRSIKDSTLRLCAYPPVDLRARLVPQEGLVGFYGTAVRSEGGSSPLLMASRMR